MAIDRGGHYIGDLGPATSTRLQVDLGALEEFMGCPPVVMYTPNLHVEPLDVSQTMRRLDVVTQLSLLGSPGEGAAFPEIAGAAQKDGAPR